VLTAEGINSARAQKVRNLSKAIKIMKKLDGKIAIVTGGNSSIRLATAQRFVAEVCACSCSLPNRIRIKMNSLFLKWNAKDLM
jgi:hypothetical protein